ncbi:UNVERIFIED_ORG: hypothetical protein GGD51_002451 [Rhizobium esperanzae]
MHNHDLPLFAWRPACQIILFPMTARVGKVRDVARKLASKTTARHADYYCSQVTEALRLHLEKVGLGEAQQDEQIGAFWSKVDQEMVRITYRGTGSNDPRGAA